jgi:hypothetical protein
VSAWTPEKVEQLKALMDEGLTFAQIGAAIGMGRCACIGKAHRLGLRRGEEAKHPPGPRGPRPYRYKPTPPPPVSIPAPTPSAGGGPVLIHELEPHHCRWPEGDPREIDTFRYCGAPALLPGPYCRDHLLRAYQPRGGRAA